jgi:hypothetical protein
MYFGVVVMSFECFFSTSAVQSSQMVCCLQ